MKDLKFGGKFQDDQTFFCFRFIEVKSNKNKNIFLFLHFVFSSPAAPPPSAPSEKTHQSVTGSEPEAAPTESLPDVVVDSAPSQVTEDQDAPVQSEGEQPVNLTGFYSKTNQKANCDLK